MNFFDYINVPKELFEKAYIDSDLVNRQKHDTFPLDIYCYGRKAVHDNVWDGVTSKCRGIIVNRETGEIVARPFEKFHNYGGNQAGTVPEGQPVVYEKLDGFMCTLYEWEGYQYIASKGSFHSVHAKWATSQLRQHCHIGFAEGWTPVFEGLCRDLRIVVDYEDREGLVLLALINNETGREAPPEDLKTWARLNNLEVAATADFTLEGAVTETLKTYNDGLGTDEGFVLVWPTTEDRPPFRLKLKYVDYLRLHRLVTGVSPKAIWEALSQPQLKSVLDEFLNNSVPWFKAFTEKWVRALRVEFDEVMGKAHTQFQVARIEVTEQAIRFSQEHGLIMPMHLMRKMYAERFTAPANKEISAILFSMLDGKDADVAVWKKVKRLTEKGHPLRDAQFC